MLCTEEVHVLSAKDVATVQVIPRRKKPGMSEQNALDAPCAPSQEQRLHSRAIQTTDIY